MERVAKSTGGSPMTRVRALLASLGTTVTARAMAPQPESRSLLEEHTPSHLNKEGRNYMAVDGLGEVTPDGDSDIVELVNEEGVEGYTATDLLEVAKEKERLKGFPEDWLHYNRIIMDEGGMERAEEELVNAMKDITDPVPIVGGHSDGTGMLRVRSLNELSELVDQEGSLIDEDITPAKKKQKLLHVTISDIFPSSEDDSVSQQPPPPPRKKQINKTRSTPTLTKNLETISEIFPSSDDEDAIDPTPRKNSGKNAKNTKTFGKNNRRNAKEPGKDPWDLVRQGRNIPQFPGNWRRRLEREVNEVEDSNIVITVSDEDVVDTQGEVEVLGEGSKRNGEGGDERGGEDLDERRGGGTPGEEHHVERPEEEEAGCSRGSGGSKRGKKHAGDGLEERAGTVRNKEGGEVETTGGGGDARGGGRGRSRRDGEVRGQPDTVQGEEGANGGAGNSWGVRGGVGQIRARLIREKHSVLVLRAAGQNPDFYNLKYSVNSLSAQVRDIRNGPDGGYAGENINKWLGYVDITNPDWDPENDLAYFEIPGCPKFLNLSCSGTRSKGPVQDVQAAIDRERIFDKRLSTGVTSNEFTEPYPAPSLPEDCYEWYKWADKSARHFGPQEYRDFLSGEGWYLASISDKLCPWAATFKPQNIFWARRMSLVMGDVELVCRSVASRHELDYDADDGVRVSFCEYCGNVIAPEATVIVYCYRYDSEAPPKVKASWPRSFIRVCFIHFVIHGQRLGRNFNEVGRGSRRARVRGGMFRR